MSAATATVTTPDPLHDALVYAQRGWRVVPIAPGTKYPKGLAAWQDAATTDPDMIRSWWTGLYKGHGVGIATGPDSGLWVLDVDDWDVLRDLERTHGELPETKTSMTGSGGTHYLFTYPRDGRTITNANRLPRGIDVRGAGGFIVAPPTVHPNGTPYAWDEGQGDEVVDAPEWLLAQVVEEEPEPRPTSIALRDITTDERPGDAWAAATDWAQILEADGWTYDHADRKGIRYWVRPGKTKREGHSATTGWSAQDNMNVFTSSLEHWGLHESGTYSKFGYLTAVHFHGDHQAASAHLASLGWGARREESPTPEPTTELPPAPPVEDEPWLTPTLPDEQAPTPPFPVHTLPSWAQDHARAAASQVQVPVDLTAMLIIGALAAATTGRAKVQVSPNWAEPTNLYLVTAMRSGSGKSAAEKLCCGWLRRWQDERIAAARTDHDMALRGVKVAEKRVGEIEKSMVMGTKNMDDLRGALVALEEAKAAVPTLPRLIADDATPEAVATLLAAYGERLAIMSTEADLFDMVLKGKTGQRASLNVYLKAWSGDPLIRDRKGGTETGPESTTIKQPLMTVAVTVQPSVLARVNGDDEMTSRGFAARFMFALPPDLIGSRDQTRRFGGERLDTAEPFEQRGRELAQRWSEWRTEALIHLEPAAAAALQAFLVEIEPQLGAGQELERLGEWVNKLHGSIARYAGILHLAEGHSPSVPIPAATMDRAIELGRYWLATAVVVLGMADTPLEQAEAILEWMAGTGKATFKLRDVQDGVRRPGIGLEKVADYVPALMLLVDNGWLRPLVDNWQDHVGVKSKTAPAFALWPGCHGECDVVATARTARGAYMGERALPLPPPTSMHPTPSPPTHAPRAVRAVLESEAPVDNSGTYQGQPIEDLF